ncbi:MAG: cation:proton antiporter, partial [Oscillospiraceae bacterium]|nr:cation:proton antiporter [Oscillospiraceae bacterium]
ISFVIMTVALSMIKFHVGPVTVGFSSLLVCMMCGTIFCNTCPLSEDLMERAEKWTAPLYTLFFVISGAELELSVFVDIAIIGIGAAFIIFRSLGKYFGAYFSAHITNCSPSVKKYLGITLLPQAGVALGMSVTASALGGADAVLVRNIVLFAVLIYELFGPSLTKMALTAAGDIQPMSHAVQNRRAKKIRDAKMTEK